MKQRRTIVLSGRAVWIWAVVAIVAALPMSQVNATPVIGSELNIGSPLVAATSSQDGPSVAAGNGKYLVVWEDRRGGTEYDVYGVFVDASGQPNSGESFLISCTPGEQAASGSQRYPEAAFNGTDFLVVWLDSSSGTQHIRGCRVSTSGTVLDKGGIAISNEDYKQSSVAIASNGSGWEVVWEEYRSDTMIYGAYVQANGTAGTRASVATGAFSHYTPTIAWNGTKYLVAWEDGRSEITSSDIHAVTLNSTGGSPSSDIMISTAVGSTSIGAEGVQVTPSATAGPSGTWFVVWQDGRGTNLDIYGTRVSSAGSVQDLGGISINSYAGTQQTPAASWDGTYYQVAWRDLGRTGNIVCCRVDTSGAPQDGTGIRVYTSSAGTYSPSVASLAGSSMVAWSTMAVGKEDILGRTISSTGVLGTEATLSIAAADQPAYAAVYDGSKYVVVWSDRRSGVYNIYAARITKRGAVMDPSGVLLYSSAKDQLQPAIAWSGSTYLVVWSDDTGVLADIHGMRLDSSLNKLDATPITICGASAGQHSPCVAWNGTTFMVAWVDYQLGSDPDYFSDIFGARVSTGGVVTALSTPICNETGDQFAPAITTNNQDFLVCWEDYRGSSPSIYCGRVSGTGSVLNGTGLLVSSNTAAKMSPAAASDGTNYLVVWSDSRGASPDIYGVRLSALAARLDASDLPICTQTSEQLYPSVAWTGDNYYVGWQDFRNSAASDYDIYFGRLSPHGSIIDPGGVAVATAINTELRPVVVPVGADSSMIFYSNLIYSTHRLVARTCGEPSAIQLTLVGQAKALADGTRVRVASRIVTAGVPQLGGRFYIEDLDRTSGLKVVTNDPIGEKYLVDVTGTIGTVNGERQIVATAINVISQNNAVPAPLAVRMLSLGGVDLNQYTPGVYCGLGPNNLGLLVRTWGKVTSMSSNTFYIQDGLMYPKQGSLPPELMQLKVTCPAGVTPPSVGAYVGVTGISSCEPNGTKSDRLLLVRKTGDIN